MTIHTQLWRCPWHQARNNALSLNKCSNITCSKVQKYKVFSTIKGGSVISKPKVHGSLSAMHLENKPCII